MKIDILLPFKEQFSKDEASAVSLTVRNAMQYSEYFENIRVFGQKTQNPFYKKNFYGLNNNWIMHGGHNKSLAYNYYKKNLEDENNIKKIIEVHNRPYIFNFLKNKINNHPLTMHFHNDPQTMKGSKTIKERELLVNSAAAIYFVSHFIKNKFLEGLNKKYEHLHVLHNSCERKHMSMPNKKKEVLFIGRLVPEKGAHIYCKSISKIANDFNDWKFILIGASKAGQRSPKSGYEVRLIKEFEDIGSNTEYLGFVNNDIVQKKMSEASILVIPSIWEEPFCLVAIEGLCHAATIISSNKGGLPELIQDNGILLQDINEKNLKEKIKELILNEKLIIKYQKNAWKNYKFNSSENTKKQDYLRSTILKDFYS